MAHLLVSDTSVLIDLERGNLLQATFQLPTPLAVPDLLYERELAPTNGELLLSLGLRKLPLDPAGTALAQTYRGRVRALSLPDAFALALAKQGGHTLVCGDRRLRDLSDTEGVTCHGVLWVLDQILDAGIRPKSELADALRTIAAHPRCRLPRGLVAEHLTRYSTK
jgi:hypothetical protein